MGGSGRRRSPGRNLERFRRRTRGSPPRSWGGRRGAARPVAARRRARRRFRARRARPRGRLFRGTARPRARSEGGVAVTFAIAVFEVRRRLRMLSTYVYFGVFFALAVFFQLAAGGAIPWANIDFGA